MAGPLHVSLVVGGCILFLHRVVKIKKEGKQAMKHKIVVDVSPQAFEAFKELKGKYMGDELVKMVELKFEVAVFQVMELSKFLSAMTPGKEANQ